MATKDVELVIRARQEGGKVIESLTSGLRELVGVQGDLKNSAKGVDTVLGQLGSEIGALGQQVQNLRDFGKVVTNLDKAAEAITRLESRLAGTSSELDALTAAQKRAADSAEQAKAAAQRTANAYEAQKAAAAAVRKEAGASSDAYKQEAAALGEAKAARDAATVALRQAISQETAVNKAVDVTSAQVVEQATALGQAKAAWEALFIAAEQTGKSMGGVVASQDAVAAAAGTAAEKLALAKGAMQFRQEADEAARLRKAADYINFWTQALREKDEVEAKSQSARMSAVFEEAQQQAKKASVAEIQYQATLNERLGIQDQVTKSARDSFSVFEQAGVLEDKMTAATERLRAQVNPLGAVQASLNRELKQARDLYRAGYISATELAAAEVVLGRNAEMAAKAIQSGNASGKGGQIGFLGLRPYELNSLSFQINDVFTQLGSGTPVLQVLAQQGGQVFQVFQRQLVPVLAKIGPTVAAAAPEIAIVVAALTAVGIALKNIADRTDSVRQFSGELAASADGAQYNAKALAETAHQLDVFGGSLANARAELVAFTKKDINPALLESFGRAAQDFAKVSGKEVKTAAEEMSAGLSAGYDAIVKLDDGFNFLSAAERKHIKELFDSGQAARARTEAFNIFQRQMDEGARSMRGPWAEAIKNLTAAWDNFLGFLENSAPIKGAVELLRELAVLAKDVSSHLPGAGERAAAAAGAATGTTPEMVRLEREITTLRKERADAAERESAAAKRMGADGKPAGGLITGNRPYNLRGSPEAALRTTAELDQKILTLEGNLEALRKQAKDTIDADSQARLKARDEALAGVAREHDALGVLTDARKVQLAGEQAYQDAIRETGDVAVAQAKRQLAIEKELQRQRLSVNFDRLSGKIVGAESSGDPNAKNPRSTATGLGQFVEATWLKLFKEHFPAEAKGQSDAAILDLRKNAELSRKVVELYARENADVLQKAGVAVNEAALYLAHFLGPQGAIAVLTAAAKTPIAKLLSTDAIKVNPEVLKNKTAGDVVQFAQRKVGNSDEARAQLDAEASVAELLLKNQRERQKAQENLNDAISDENAKRNQTADDLNASNGLMHEALILEQRRIAIKDAVAAAEEKVHEASENEIRAGRAALVLTDEQRKAIEASTAARFDAAHSADMLAARREVAEERVNSIMERRQLLIEQIGVAQQLGDVGMANQAIVEFEALNGQLDDAIAKVIQFWDEIAGDPTKLGQLGMTAQQVQNIVTSMQQAGLNAKNLGNQALLTGAQINQSIAQGGARAFDSFAQKVAEGQNAFAAARDAFLQFAADFLRQIAQMIIQQIILNALGGGSGGGGGGVGGTIASTIGSIFAPKKHSGGMVGGGGNGAWVPAEAFANALRYHGGGIAGLKPDEVPTILKRNEEILTTDDPRHRFNGGGADAGTPVEDRFKIVNMIDSGDMLDKGLGSRVGERALINFIRANASEISGVLGG